VISLENKETFRAFALAPGPFDLVVLCGGRPNRAVRALLALCARLKSRVWHAGDLDPDGLAIAGDLHARFGARPFGMDLTTFERYLPQARLLGLDLIRRLDQLSEDTLALGEFRALAARIAQTGRGLEQEIIDYTPLLRDLEAAGP